MEYDGTIVHAYADEEEGVMLAYLMRINVVQTVTIIVLSVIVLLHLIDHYRRE